MNPDEMRDATERSWDERWLEDALTNYGAAEPRPGLETRILANLETCALRRQRRWTFAFAALAAVLFAVLMAEVKHPNSGTAPNMASKGQPPVNPGTVPNMGNQVSSQSPRAAGQLVREHRSTASGDRPNGALTQGQSADGNPSDAHPDSSDVAEQEQPLANTDPSDPGTASADLVALEQSAPAESQSGSGASASVPAAQPRSMPEISISDLNIKPIQIKEIPSGRTTD